MSEEKLIRCHDCKDTGSVPHTVEAGKVTKWQDCNACMKCPDCKNGTKADGTECVERIPRAVAETRGLL
jgi:hypothetical protein